MENKSEVTIKDVREAASQMVNQKGRPSAEQLSGYFALAQRLPDLELNSYYEIEKRCRTPRFLETQREVRALLGY